MNGVADYIYAAPSVTAAPILYEPANVAMVKFLLKTLSTNIRRALMSLYQPKWNIGIVQRPVTDFLASQGLGDVDWCGELPKGQYLADPMALSRAGLTHVLCEKYDYESKGSICRITYDGTSWSDSPVPSIEIPTHASYPFLLERRGEVYCIPETFEAKQSTVFKAIEFPNAWENVGAILHGFSSVDTTPFQHDGGWWLFCTDDDDGPNYKLQLWYADDLLGPWSPHPANPVKIDVRSARPAGPPFVHDGTLYRPAQDCSKVYGGAITINKISTLTMAKFEEEVIAIIQPDSRALYPNGIHTLCSAGSICVVDGQRNELKTRLMSRGIGKIAGVLSRVTSRT
ncbi:MAG: hypothetical protein GIW99_05420 [Candidatus Eremiobacteraeota bacterium]|nr:hypothetical protein [Candidatus Eremiobacteraeota bacterium]